MTDFSLPPVFGFVPVLVPPVGLPDLPDLPDLPKPTQQPKKQRTTTEATTTTEKPDECEPLVCNLKENMNMSIFFSSRNKIWSKNVTRHKRETDDWVGEFDEDWITFIETTELRKLLSPCWFTTDNVDKKSWFRSTPNRLVPKQSKYHCAPCQHFREKLKMGKPVSVSTPGGFMATKRHQNARFISVTHQSTRTDRNK